MAADGRPPELGPEATSALVTTLFPFQHVSVNSIRPLPSYDDRNIYFTATLEPKKGNGSCLEEPFVLKLCNCYTTTVDVLEGLNAVMLFLNERDLEVPCCHPVASRAGSHVVVVPESEMTGEPAGSDARYPVRVVRFIPGEVMDKLEKRHLTRELSYSVGRMVGRLDLALQDFRHPALDGRKLEDWDLQYFTDVKRYIPHLRDNEKRETALVIVAMYEEHIVPALPSMKKGVVHNDMNGMNIIFKVTKDGCEMAGVIDFSDCIHTCYLFELAIMLAYAMCEKEAPVQFVAPMLQGYRDAFPVSKEELDCLYYAVLARLCQSAVNGEYRFSQEPWNMYLLTTPAEAWRLMRLLLTLTKEGVEEIWDIS